MAALRRRFNDLDARGNGRVTCEDIVAALGRLGMPFTEERVAAFVRKVTAGTSRACERAAGCALDFDQFCDFAVRRERELLRIFVRLDDEDMGFLTPRQLRRGLQTLGYGTVPDADVSAMLRRIKTGAGAFSKGGGLLSGETPSYLGRAIDFAEFRDFFLLADASDMGEIFKVWERACMDLGDAEVSFPLAGTAKESSVQKSGRRDRWAVAKHLATGAISGGVSRTFVAPLERVKIEYMLSSGVARQEGTVGTLRRIIANEGLWGLFKGNTLNVARIAPTKAVEFFIYDTYKAFLLRAGAGKDGTKTDLNGFERMLGGSVASMAGTALSHPVDTLRSRVTVQAVGAGEALRQILKHEGAAALWKGLLPNMVRVAPYGAINFFTYDCLKSAWRDAGRAPGVASTMLFGALAGAAAQTAVYPLEMVQRRIQVQGSAGNPVVYRNMLHGLATVCRTEGAGALYAGLPANYLKLMPAAAISFLVYEVLKEAWSLN